MAPTVGIIGGGQLARMLALAAAPMGIRIKLLAAESDEGAAEVVDDVVIGGPMDADAIRDFAAGCDAVTIDHENVNLEALADLEASGLVVAPTAGTIGFANKALQRRSFSAAGLPVPAFLVLDETLHDKESAAAGFAGEHGGQVVAKASTGGYDGRGVWMLSEAELPGFLADYEGAPLVLEPALDLQREFAVVVARSASGETAVWPVVDTIQDDGMCRLVVSPADLPRGLAERAGDVTAEIADLVGLVGVLAVEFFVVDGEILINEVAPRVHNSGHITIDANETSQFEQHLRAVLDWPLGPTELRCGSAAMVNVVGGESVDPAEAQSEALAVVPGAHIHLYGKESRPKRKLGHVTVVGENRDTCVTRAEKAAAALEGRTAG